MAELLLGNVEESVSDDEINAFLQKYGFPPYDNIQRVAGAGSRPAALLHYANVTDEVLRMLQPRVHNMFWNNRTISVQVLPVHEAD
ncbi:RNA-binding protein [Paraburkholderia sp. J63]|uniref:RNA recognition motif domain-containing protein n=1 Tax=Paraburkholderia sp. J63 TaxID=2805434 RepID=UPI002ABDBD52|nr:RNA-binding protein [Paraburkholderia sp. J63]